MNKYIKSKYFALGIYFLIIQIIIIYINKTSYELISLFWFCNNAPLFLSIAFFLRKIQVVKGIISVGFVAQIGWIIDFIGERIFSISIFGFTNYLSGLEGFVLVSTIMIHLFSLTIAMFFTYSEKIQKESLIYSITYGIILVILTIQFTPLEYNINCLNRICGTTGDTTQENYNVYLIVFYFLLIIPGYFIQKILQKSKPIAKKKINPSTSKT
jgi:hypothetical protein